MDAKKIGLIAAIVVALGLVGWSLKATFMDGPRVVGPVEGQKMGDMMKEQYKKMEAARGEGASPRPGPPANNPGSDKK